jgi:glycosyltransferase involved in cell wall biosynthesis
MVKPATDTAGSLPELYAPRPVRVGLNLVYLVPGQTGGMETYARELIPALRRTSPGIELVAFVNREAASGPPGPWHENCEVVTVPVNARRRVEWVKGEQADLPRLAARCRVDLVHSLASTAPWWGRFRRVTTIHDLIYRHESSAHFGLNALGMRVLVPLAARRSDRVIAVSETTARDVAAHLPVDRDKVDVVPNGVRAPAAAAPRDMAALRAELGTRDRPLLLSPSAKRPHKNLVRLLEALASLPAPRPLLVLPGYPTPHEAELRRRAAELGVEADVRFEGWLDEDRMEQLYAAADLVVLPSLHEGFGLPVLEAMGRGVPVACSNSGALSEVAGEAAATFDPRRFDDIARAIVQVLSDADLAASLRAAGRERTAEFSWERTARLTVSSYERALA